MPKLAPFSNRAVCQKCGSSMFEWKWFPVFEEQKAPIEMLRRSGYRLSNEEHLRLTCGLCGWAFAMEPKNGD